MKKMIITGFLSLCLLGANAQDLPKPSPSATIEQQVGLTNIKIQYSRPSVKGRKVFGELVAYDKVWRLGANKATNLTTDKDMMFGKQTLKPGSYAIFAIPAEKGNWKVVINSDTEQWGTGNYDEAKNVVTMDIAPKTTDLVETFSITIEDITANSANIVIAWEKTKLVLPFTLDTDKAAEENIAAAIKEGKDLEKVYYRSASYQKDAKGDLKMALEHIEKSIKVKEYHGNVFLKASIIEAQGNKKEAIKLAEQALKLANDAEEKGWASYIEETITAWKK
jgi:tetratricopeptide (TPR) repeat protein